MLHIFIFVYISQVHTLMHIFFILQIQNLTTNTILFPYNTRRHILRRSVREIFTHILTSIYVFKLISTYPTVICLGLLALTA